MTSGESAVSTSHPAATQVAVDVLRAGGNAVDAAVAAAWALAVCEPSGSGFGGQVCLLVATPDGRVRSVDGPGRAPAGVRRSTVSRSGQRRGVRATTVPTTPAVLGHAHARWGRLEWSEVLLPAIAMAEQGFRMTRLESRRTGWVAAQLRADPGTAQLYLVGGRAPRAGKTVRMPALAATLRTLACDGSEDAYVGAVAAAMVRDQERCNGLITAADLELARSVREQDAAVLTHGGHRIATLATAGGSSLLLALAVLDRLAPEGGWTDPEWSLAAARATRVAQANRDVSDPEGEPRPAFDARALEGFTDRARRPLTRTSHDARGGDSVREEPGDTTHLCVVDGEGTAVSLTSSIQSLFGAKVACTDLGFVYNNYLRTCTRSAGPYRLGPGSQPRSNAAPTIVLDDQGPVLVTGSAGSRRITSSLVHVISGVLVRDMDVQTAVDHSRSHLLSNGRLWVERSDETEVPGGRDRSVRLRAEHDYMMGAVQAVHRTGTGLAAAADPRRGGVALVLPATCATGLATTQAASA
jgi:gamma-glutamyltranspeptidase / glutathione hydrolase